MVAYFQNSEAIANYLSRDPAQQYRPSSRDARQGYVGEWQCLRLELEDLLDEGITRYGV
jgi:hypothetical protein